MGLFLEGCQEGEKEERGEELDDPYLGAGMVNGVGQGGTLGL